MSQNEIANISSEPTFNKRSLSPQLPEGSFGLDFVAKFARNERGDATVALFAKGRVPAQPANVYGGRLHSATHVVAIERQTGRVFHRAAESAGDVLALPLVMNLNPRAPRKDVAQTLSAEFYFNLDLRAHLNLPPQRAVYSIFLWLDEMVSLIQIVEVPAQEGARLMFTGKDDASDAPFYFRKTELSPSAGIETIALNYQAPKISRASADSIRLYGAISPALLAANTDGQSSAVTVLALDYRSRTLRWRSVSPPARALQMREGFFDLDINKMFDEQQWASDIKPPQKVFVLAYMRQVLSRVLTIDLNQNTSE